jgi:hypothetical protein
LNSNILTIKPTPKYFKDLDITHFYYKRYRFNWTIHSVKASHLGVTQWVALPSS